MTSNSTNDQFSFWDMARAGIADLGRGPALARGVGMLAASRFLTHISIGRLVERHARRQPNRCALRFEQQSYSYAEFNAAANRYARVLQSAGVGSGDVVAMLLENRPETLLAVVATVKLGAVAAMCNTKQRGAVLAHSLSLVKPAAVLVGDELREAFGQVRADIGFAGGERVWRVPLASAVPDEKSGDRDLLAEAASQSTENLPETAMVEQSCPAFYIFTSGTTGMPKASKMSHTRWLRAGAGLGLAGMGLRGDDVFYCCLPLYHNNALTVSWSSVLCAGATLALGRKFSVSRFWVEARQHQATAFSYIGELCRYLLRAAPGNDDRGHQLRVMIGNGLRPDIWDEFKQRFGIAKVCEFYGASEGNLVFVNGFNMDRTAGFCPLPFAVVAYDHGKDAPVRHASGCLQKVERGGVGLLLTKITEMAPFEGYTDDSESEKKLFRDAFKPGDCWFNTGDLVRDQGMRHIAFVDRLGDTFRWKGENVATTEVERALDAHPAISESVVYGVTVPGADGRAGMAAITPAADIDWTDLTAHLRRELPAYAVPVFLRLRGEQEVTGTFKFRKVDLKEEGYRPKADEPVYFLPAKGQAYERLTDEQRAEIDQGSLRL